MKHNYFAYFIYCLYLIFLFLLSKYLLFSPDAQFLIVLSIWFLPPVLFAIIPMIIAKRFFLRYATPSLTSPLSIAVLTTVQSIVLPVVFSVLLALLASMIRMGLGDMPSFELWGVSQTVQVIALEVLSLLVLFAWVTRSVEYHAIWHRIEAKSYVRVRRILLYANIFNYILITVSFIIWQLMLFYQIPEFFWKMV